VSHPRQKLLGWSLFFASVVASAWSGAAAAESPATAAPSVASSVTTPPRAADDTDPLARYRSIAVDEAELMRGLGTLSLPAGINVEVWARMDNVSWTVSIGSNERGPARLIDLAKAVGMDDHDRSKVLVAWSDRIAAQLRDLTVSTVNRTRPERAFYPETEFGVTVAGHPFPSALAKDDPAREASTRFTRTYDGNDCVRYFNGELKVDTYMPRGPAVGSVAARVTFDSLTWDLKGSKQGTVVVVNTSPNRVRVLPDPSVIMTMNGAEVPFKRNDISCWLPLYGPPPDLVLGSGATGSMAVVMVTSTPYGRYELSAGPLAIKVTAICVSGVPVDTAITSVIATGKVPPDPGSTR